MATMPNPDNQNYQKQIIRFGDRGINLSVPPELVPLDQYAVFNDVVSNRDGTLQAAAGSIVLFTAPNTHTLRRFENHTTGATFYVVGTGQSIELFHVPGGLFATPEAGTMSGNPMTFVPYRIAVLSDPYMYVGDSAKMIKISTAGTSTRTGIVRPLTVFGQIGLVPVASGAGNLVGDYDWRYTYARYVGSTKVAESNPSDIGTTITLASEQADLTVVASNALQGDITNINLYRRGGTLPDEWRLVTTLTNTNQTYTDNTADVDLEAADILELDNDVPVTSVDSAGATLNDLNAVPLPYLWGPLNETLFGCCDPHRPDVVYYSKKGFPEAWPPQNTVSMDSPQDQCVNGFIYDGKSFVFTQSALYELIPNILDGLTWTPQKTPCGWGIVSPFAFCVGRKVWFCAKDGVYEWAGMGQAVRISDPIRPLFPYQAQEGYSVSLGSTLYEPVDFDFGINPNVVIRMAYHNGEVWFHFRDVSGAAQTAVYNDDLQSWRFVAPNTYIFTYSDEVPQSNLLGVDLDGDTSQFTAGTREGNDIHPIMMTGGHDQGFPRADKEYGDAAVWANCAGKTVNLLVYINSDFAAAAYTQQLTGTGLQKYIINLAGLYARHIAFEFGWSSSDTNQPILYWIETSYIPRPEEILDRQTDWDDLGHAADKNVKGLLITADTNNQPITIEVLYDGGTVGATFTIGPDPAGFPRTYNIGWGTFRARKVRIRPTSTTEWKFYGINRWLFDAEPEALDCHDVYWGDGGYPHDKLVKGITVEADCNGAEQTLSIYDDQGVLQEQIILGPGIAGIPNIYEFSWASFRTRNIRIMECGGEFPPPPICLPPIIT